MIRTALFLAMLVIPGCPSAPAAPDSGDADASFEPAEAASSCAKACKNLAALGCSEGAAADCTVTCQRTQAARLTDLKPACLSTAKTKAGARACGPAVACK